MKKNEEAKNLKEEIKDGMNRITELEESTLETVNGGRKNPREDWYNDQKRGGTQHEQVK